MAATEINDIAAIVRHHGAECPERDCIVYGDRRITWAEMQTTSNTIAHALRAAGVGPQDRIARIDKNGPDYFELLFGAAKINAVLVDVNWRLAPPEMAQIVNDAEAKVLFVGEEFLSHLDKFEGELATVQTVVVVGGSHATHQSYDEWLASAAGDDDPGEQPAPDDVCLQLYTSGTTGLPKGVMLTNRNLFSFVEEVPAKWGLRPEAVAQTVMPLFHIAGSGWSIVSLTMGCPVILEREVDPARILADVVEHRVTHAFYVPAVLQFLLMVPGVDEMDFSSLEFIGYGASPITEKVLRRSIEVFKCSFVQAYGLTETTGAIVQLDPEDHDPENRPELLRAAGKPYPWIELRCVDPDTGSDVADGDVGEVWVRGVQVMKGYWNKPEETAKAITSDGWFRTGDAGFVKDGYLFLHDRVKDMIVTGGENVYPAEVENALMSHPGIADVAVIGVPDEKWGEAVKAIVVRAEGADGEAATPEAIIAFARERLGGFKVPKSVDFIDVLPRNPSGKILKKDLREPYWAGKERRIG